MSAGVRPEGGGGSVKAGGNPPVSRRSTPARTVGTPSDGRYLLLTSRQWRIGVVVGAVLALVTIPYYKNISFWPGVAMFLLGLVIVHMRYASRFVIPFPHIAMAIALLQHVLAAWISNYYPSANSLYNIGQRLPQYLHYGAPVVIACMMGWGCGVAKLPPPSKRLLRPGPRLLGALDILIAVGVVGKIAAAMFSAPSIYFTLLLIANLRYVGVFGRMLCKAPGWGWRLAIVIGLEVLFSSESASFHGLILWAMWTMVLWVYVFTPSWKMISALIAAGVVMLVPLNESKWRLRDHIFGENQEMAVETGLSAAEKAALWLTFLADSVGNIVTGNLDEDFIGETVMRYNQAWIVERVIMNVPDGEPYAKGETIVDSVFSVLVPRFLAPNKIKAGGRENMERFAAMRLEEGTSMNLGYAGEMYANFGYWGGIVGCGIYALGFALLFRAGCVRAFKAPLWWAVIPYVGFSVLKSEEDLVSVLNWTARSALIIGLIVLALPVVRRALFPAAREFEAGRGKLQRQRGGAR